MLKGIPKNISPELMKTLMEMGHGDEIVIADGNFPLSSLTNKPIRADGNKATEMLDSILQLFPIDIKVKTPIIVMNYDFEDDIPSIYTEFERIIKKHNIEVSSIRRANREEFYNKSRSAYAIIGTSEERIYGNIIIKKGIVLNTSHDNI